MRSFICEKLTIEKELEEGGYVVICVTTKKVLYWRNNVGTARMAYWQNVSHHRLR